MRLRNNQGAVLVETVLAAMFWGALIAGTHMAVIRYWNQRLDDLDQTRTIFDGIRRL